MKTLEQLGISSAPWKIDRQGDIAGRGDELVAFAMCLGRFCKAEELANAHLIAAAPELYEALREVYETVTGVNVHFTSVSAWLAKASGALEKAGGAALQSGEGEEAE